MEDRSLKNETFLSVVERYLEENGSDALEKLIANKVCRTLLQQGVARSLLNWKYACFDVTSVSYIEVEATTNFCIQKLNCHH